MKNISVPIKKKVFFLFLGGKLKFFYQTFSPYFGVRNRSFPTFSEVAKPVLQRRPATIHQSSSMPALDAHWSPVHNARHKFFVYSAYYDDRMSKIIRVIAATLRVNSIKEVRVDDHKKKICMIFFSYSSLSCHYDDRRSNKKNMKEITFSYEKCLF